MPEANVLYSVTAVVVAGLAVWVAAALKMAKEPWPRPQAAHASATARTPDVPVEKTEEPAPDAKDEEKADEAKADEAKASEEKASEENA